MTIFNNVSIKLQLFVLRQEISVLYFILPICYNKKRKDVALAFTQLNFMILKLPPRGVFL